MLWMQVKPSLLSTAQEKMHAALQAAADGGDELVNKVVADAVASPSTRGHKASASTPGSAKRSAKRVRTLHACLYRVADMVPGLTGMACGACTVAERS